MPDKFTNFNTDYAGMNNLTRFNGFFNNVYKEPFTSGYSYIFMTKPMLFIDNKKPVRADSSNERLAYMNMTRDPLFIQFLETENENPLDNTLLKSLSYKNESKSNFLPIITNECKSFDVQDITIEQVGTFDTKQNLRQNTPTYTTQSVQPGTISLNVSEDANLTFNKMMTIWVNYMNNITDGTFDANPVMIQNGVLDYTSSIYHFVLEPDGRTVKYWAKYTGCWPTNIPSSSMSYRKGEINNSEVNLQFVFNFREEMNPKILEDFNKVSLKLSLDIESGNIVDNTYRSFIDSPYLNREKLLGRKPDAKNLLNSEMRDPLVFYQPGSLGHTNTDKTLGRFELVFDDFAYKSPLLNDIFDDNDLNYFVNIKGNNNIKDNPDDFWS